MSALAQVMLKLGYRVSGSDLKESALTRHLASQGAEVIIGHHRDNLGQSGLVVFSTAIPAHNPEMEEARARNLPLWHRSELLACLLNSHYGIAVAGTHGKTTTTTMIALLLEQGGLDPTAIIGGVVSSFNGNARIGRSRYLVAEACESDHSFLRYYPRIALITNIEPDHLEHYNGSFDRLYQAYIDFLDNLHPEGCAIICTDDPQVRRLKKMINRDTVTYGLEGGSGENTDFCGRQINISGKGSTFVLYRGDRPVTGEIVLKAPGRHNICNAVGALAVASRLGLDPAQCAVALREFRGAGRRFEIIAEINDIMVVDDYAHHPTEVRVTLETARSFDRRIICIFQPHRYTRTAYFFDDFARAFSGADLVLLHRIYSAGEEPISGISSSALAERIRREKGGPVLFSDEMIELENMVLEQARPGDIILVMGAGDISRLAHSLAERLREGSRTG